MNDKSSVFDKKVFRERLKEVSKNKSWTAIQEECDISQSLTKLTSDKYTDYPSIDVLLRIANKYDCTIDYLVGHDISNKIESKKRLSFRDLCRLIVQIDEQFKPGIQLSQYTAYNYVHEGEVIRAKEPTLKHPYAYISFLPEIHEYRLLERHHEIDGAYSSVSNGYTRGYVEINNFIEKYLRLKEARRYLDKEQYNMLINEMIMKDVSDDPAPFPEEIVDSDFVPDIDTQ